MDEVWLGLTLISLGIWIGLICFRGQFWQADQRLDSLDSLDSKENHLQEWPAVCAVVPARNEAEVIAQTLRSLLNQNYPGQFTVILVDDQSSDGTAAIATQTAQALGKESQLKVISGEPLPPSWTGKLWALEQGIQSAQGLNPAPDYLLLTDADIHHDLTNLRRLVTKAETETLDLVSLMVLLRCQSFWEQFLIPSFVFFFQKLYPFRWVNNPQKATAAAAGGCILIRQTALNQIGGIQVVRQALIDDCALGQAVKSTGKGRIWLGLSPLVHSLRSYASLETIWEMVARTAYTQLSYSSWQLVGTVIAMSLIYLVPVLGAIGGALIGNWAVVTAGILTWLLMALAYLPTLRLYQISPLWAFSLPLIGGLYTLMTIDSARRHWRGQGGAWKGRVYSIPD